MRLRSPFRRPLGAAVLAMLLWSPHPAAAEPSEEDRNAARALVIEGRAKLAAHDNEGTVFSMAGDSMLVGFNVPVPQPDATERALTTGRTVIQRFGPVAARWKNEHGLSTGVGVGIESGEVVVGNVGAPSFMSYTIIGDPVNVAARLMQKAAPNELLIGPRASLSLHSLLGRSTALERREVVLKGKAEPVEVVSLRVAPA